MDSTLAEFAKYGGLVLALAIACSALWFSREKLAQVVLDLTEKVITMMGNVTNTLNSATRSGEVMAQRLEQVENALKEVANELRNLKGRQ